MIGVLTRFQVWFPKSWVKKPIENGKNLDRHVLQGILWKKLIPPSIQMSFLNKSCPLLISDAKTLQNSNENFMKLSFSLYLHDKKQQEIELWLRSQNIYYHRFDVSMESITKKTIFGSFSPIIVYDNGKNLHPEKEKEAFLKKLHDNLLQKMLITGFLEGKTENFNLEISLKKGKVVQRDIQGKRVRGFLGLVGIESDYGIAQLAAYAFGLGTNNAQGFGMLSLKHEFMHFINDKLVTNHAAITNTQPSMLNTRKPGVYLHP